VGTASARERLIAAAKRCFERHGVARTRVDDIAAEAKVSRATVYRYFRDRDDLILAVLEAEADAFLVEFRQRLSVEAPLEEQLIDGVVFAVAAVRQDERLALLFTPESVGITTAVAGAWELLFDRARTAMAPLLEAWRASGDLREDVGLDEAVEWILRMVLSLLTVPGPRERSEDELRAFLQTFFVPGLARPAA
jgi:AcrR family transcriptional regulator